MDAEAELLALEGRLNPAEPERCPGVKVLGYGEVSAVLGYDGLPGTVLKRMSGFPSRGDAESYAAVVERYIAILRGIGVAVAPTEIVLVAAAPERHVAYLIQPRLDPTRLGNTLLRDHPLAEVQPLLERVLEIVRAVLEANRARSDGREIAIDAQLSNWSWPEDERQARPVLLDVGTPFMRLDGALETGTDLFLRAYPAPVRWWMRRDHSVEKYIADYFHFDRTVLDLLGNFVKEGAAEKLPAAVALVRAWSARQPVDALAGVDVDRARAYYARDASSLEISLRARRAARFVRTALLRRRYDFVLPGRIAR